MALSWEAIREGDLLPERLHRCTRMDIVKYAAASGDFYPLHLDPDAPESRERGKLIVPGRFKQVCLGRLVVEWVGPAGFLRRLVCRYVDEDTVGEPIVCRGEIRRRFVERET